MANDVKLLTSGATPTSNKNRHPFSAGAPIRALSPGAAVITGVNRAAQFSPYNLSIVLDGATTVIDTDDLPNLALANVAGTLDANTTLEVIVEINGVPITRVDDGATPTAGQWRIAVTGGKNTITLGSTYGAGTVVRIYLGKPAGTLDANGNPDPLAVTTIATLVAGQPQEITCYDFMRATTANAVIESLAGV